MNISDRIRVKFALASRRETAIGECPTPEDILVWHEHGLSPIRATHVQRHVAHCDHCFALWSGLVDLDAEQDTLPAKARAGFWPRWLRFGVPALAAGVLGVSLWMGMLDSDPIAQYQLSVQAGLDVRGGDTATRESLSLDDGNYLEIVVMPDTAVAEAMAIHAYLGVDGTLRRIDANTQVTDKGVASLEGIVGTDIIVPADATRLYVAVGRRDDMPSANKLRRVLADKTEAENDDWRAWAFDLVVSN